MKFLGEAEAFAIEAKAKAEAEQMAKKAEAWGEYKEAALVEMILQVMPKLAAEIAGNFSFLIITVTCVTTLGMRLTDSFRNRYLSPPLLFHLQLEILVNIFMHTVTGIINGCNS
jgi:hypothetical protein